MEALLLQAYKQCGYRRASGRWVGGHHDVVVEVVERPEDASVGYHTEKVWHRRHTWRGMNSSHTLRVPCNWAAAVHGRGLAVLDGLLTLAVWRTPHSRQITRQIPQCLGAVEAIWVEQGRGTAIRAVRGLLVLDQHGWFHVDESPAAAVVARAINRRAKRLRSVEALGECPSDLTVTVEDARSAGLCLAGIRDFCSRHGLALSRPVPARTLLEIVASSGDRTAAVLAAVRAARERATAAEGAAR